MITLKKIAVAGICASLLAVGGCTALDRVLGTNTASLTPQQKVVLTAQVVNGLCVLSAAGFAFAGGVNSVVHPNAGVVNPTTGQTGSGTSAAGTITKASQIDALSCQSLNGVEATLLATTSSGAATVQVAQ